VGWGFVRASFPGNFLFSGQTGACGRQIPIRRSKIGYAPKSGMQDDPCSLILIPSYLSLCFSAGGEVILL